MIDLPPPFVCEVVKVRNADGPLWCKKDIKVRVASVQARTIRTPHHSAIKLAMPNSNR